MQSFFLNHNMVKLLCKTAFDHFVPLTLGECVVYYHIIVIVPLCPYILYINSTIVSTCLTHDIVMLRNGPNVATGDCVCWDRGFDYNGADLPIGEIFNWSRDLAKEKQDFPKKAFSTQNAKTFQFSLLLFSRSLPGRYTAACRPVRRCSVPAPRADIRF